MAHRWMGRFEPSRSVASMSWEDSHGFVVVRGRVQLALSLGIWRSDRAALSEARG